MERADANDPTVVVVAHGSRLEDANVAHLALCESLGERLGDTVVAAFLEIAEPSVGDALDAAVAAGARALVVVPYFVHPGNHTSRDIPALVEAARLRHPGVPMRLAPLFGADPALVAVLEAQVREAVADPL